MSRKLKYFENQYRNFIYKNTTKASQYEQVAKEAVELAVLITETIGGRHYDVDKKFLDIYDEKLIRWCERFEEKIGKSIEEYEEDFRRSIYSDEGTEEKVEVKEDERNV